MVYPHEALTSTPVHSLWRFASHQEIGWFLPYWRVSISDTQLKANEDGLDPDQYADLIEYLVEQGIRFSINKYGLIDIPSVGMRSMDKLG